MYIYDRKTHEEIGELKFNDARTGQDMVMEVIAFDYGDGRLINMDLEFGEVVSDKDTFKFYEKLLEQMQTFEDMSNLAREAYLHLLTNGKAKGIEEHQEFVNNIILNMDTYNIGDWIKAEGKLEKYMDKLNVRRRSEGL